MFVLQPDQMIISFMQTNMRQSPQKLSSNISESKAFHTGSMTYTKEVLRIQVAVFGILTP
jgi:hypothetical protein